MKPSKFRSREIKLVDRIISVITALIIRKNRPTKYKDRKNPLTLPKSIYLLFKTDNS